MKTLRPLLFGVLFSSSVFAAEPGLEFRGVMIGAGPIQLSLVDKSTETTKWVPVGKTFAGYTIKAYDPATETATLLKDGKELRIRINSSRIVDAPAGASGSTTKISSETSFAIISNLRQISAAADQYYMETGRNTTSLDQLVGATKYIKQLNPVAGEDYSVLKLAHGNPLSVTTASGETVTWGEAGNQPVFYTVKAGDTLAQIAKSTGISPEKLIELNGITDAGAIKVGQPLRTK